jgi:hypothetical protein
MQDASQLREIFHFNIPGHEKSFSLKGTELQIPPHKICSSQNLRTEEINMYIGGGVIKKTHTHRTIPNIYMFKVKAIQKWEPMRAKGSCNHTEGPLLLD